MDDDNVAIVNILGKVLGKLIEMNSVVGKSPTTKFQSSCAPEVSVEAYLERIRKYSQCSESCFVVALIYIDRVIETKNLVLSPLNVHRIVITCVLVAAKFLDDFFYNNAFYAKLGGISTAEMNSLELELLLFLGFSLRVTPEVYDSYYAQLKSCYGSFHVVPTSSLPVSMFTSCDSNMYKSNNNDTSNWVSWSQQSSSQTTATLQQQQQQQQQFVHQLNVIPWADTMFPDSLQHHRSGVVGGLTINTSFDNNGINNNNNNFFAAGGGVVGSVWPPVMVTPTVSWQQQQQQQQQFPLVHSHSFTFGAPVEPLLMRCESFTSDDSEATATTTESSNHSLVNSCNININNNSSSDSLVTMPLWCDAQSLPQTITPPFVNSSPSYLHDWFSSSTKTTTATATTTTSSSTTMMMMHEVSPGHGRKRQQQQQQPLYPQQLSIPMYFE